ncbi:MAG: translation elongation factor Ts [Alphaproteobacteria bacterium]
MTITATMVKELREKSGAGMMDCKKALAETDGDFEAAVDWLRKKGLSAAAKKSSRIAAEGLVGLSFDGTKGALIEVNAETDFVARNQLFQDFVLNLASLSVAVGGVDDLQGLAYPDTGRNVAEELTHNIAMIGENMSIRRLVALSVEAGAVSGYVHAAAEGSNGKLGRIGVLVALESQADAGALAQLGKQIAMHIAAANPRFLSVDEISEEDRERERNVLTEQARAEGRPENIIQKMVEGRMRKFQEEVALLEQIFVIDNETKISDLLEKQSKELGSKIILKAFARFELGEGIEKKQDDFAAEVAAAVGG